jgi:hypothetical protein
VFGSRAGKAMGQLQRTSPGIEGVRGIEGNAASAGTGWGMKRGGGGVEWAEVAPAGLVGSEVLGQQLWQVVNEVAGRA